MQKDTKRMYKNTIDFQPDIVYNNYNYSMRMSLEWEN